MNSVVSSQLTGKWYHIAGTCRRLEMYFMEIFLYLSLGDDCSLEGLVVAMRRRRTKIIKKFSLEIIYRDGSLFLDFKIYLFRIKFRMLFLDEKNAVMILSDKRQKHLSILSKKSSLDADYVEKILRLIDCFEPNESSIKLYSNCIIE